MSKSAWGPIVSCIFAIVLTVTPIPDSWRLHVVFLAWLFFLYALVGWGLANSERVRKFRSEKTGRSPMTFLVIAIVGAGLAILLWFLIPQSLRGPATPKDVAPQTPTASNVALRFVYPKSPALVIANRSESIARDIKWMVVLWNMDLADRDEPLPIPVDTFDWLRPHQEGGPQSLFGLNTVAPLVKPGDRLFGSAAVSCPDCTRGRTYVVYIVYGEGGWFSELENETSGNAIIPRNLMRETREAYFRHLESTILEQSRIPIGELQDRS